MLRSGTGLGDELVVMVVVATGFCVDLLYEVVIVFVVSSKLHDGKRNKQKGFVAAMIFKVLVNILNIYRFNSDFIILYNCVRDSLLPC